MRIAPIAATTPDAVTKTNTAESTKGGSRTLTVGKLGKKGRTRELSGRKAKTPASASRGRPIHGARSSAQSQSPDTASPTLPLSPLAQGVDPAAFAQPPALPGTPPMASNASGPSPTDPAAISDSYMPDSGGWQTAIDAAPMVADSASFRRGGEVKRRGWGKASLKRV